jgi:AcrR family transcriptional regulator
MQVTEDGGDPRAGDERWVRRPRQARSQETLERFVEATRLLLADRAFDEITVHDIVAAADRTVGSFYARFDDKDAVLHVLVERLDERIQHVVRAFCDPVRWEGVPLAEFVGEAVRLNVQAYRRTTSLFRAALLASARDERFRSRRLHTLRATAEMQKAFLLTRTDEMATDDPSRASDQMFELVAATLDHELLFGRFTVTSPDADSVLVDELTDQCLHVLRVTSPVVPAGSTGSTGAGRVHRVSEARAAGVPPAVW